MTKAKRKELRDLLFKMYFHLSQDIMHMESWGNTDAPANTISEDARKMLNKYKTVVTYLISLTE